MHALRIGLIAATLAAVPALATAAQGHATHGGHDSAGASSGDPAATEAERTMSGGHRDPRLAAHMRMTPSRPITREDSVRAARIVADLRRALERYRDVRVATADGFRQFAPGMQGQRVHHFTNYRQAFAEHFRFDPAKPTSLLYEQDSAGRFILAGAMYVAPKRASAADLDARIPLSVAQWHAHVNVCVPGRRDRERWRETRDGQMLFGPAGIITTKAACDAERGRFHEQLFGWMVHANVFRTDDALAAFGEKH